MPTTPQIANGELGATVRAKLNAVLDRAQGSTTLITGAAPVICNDAVRITEIVTGGTGGQEVIKLSDPQPYYGVDGFGTALEALRIKIFVLKSKANEADTIRIDPQYFESDVWVDYADDGGVATLSGDRNAPSILLDTVNRGVVFVYTGTSWAVLDAYDVTASNWTVLAVKVPKSPFSNTHPVLSDEGGTPTWRNDLGHFSNGEDLVSGATPVVCDPSTHISGIQSGRTGGVEYATLAVPEDNFIGGRKKIFFVTGGPETLSIETAHIQKADGSGLLSSLILGNGQWALLEHWDETHWRLLRTTGAAT